MAKEEKQSTESQVGSDEKAKDCKAMYEAQMAEYKKLQGRKWEEVGRGDPDRRLV